MSETKEDLDLDWKSVWVILCLAYLSTFIRSFVSLFVTPLEGKKDLSCQQPPISNF